MDDAKRQLLVDGIVGHASADEVTDAMKLRVVAYWTRVDEQLGSRVAAGLGLSNGSAPPTDQMRQAQELVDSRAGTA